MDSNGVLSGVYDQANRALRVSGGGAGGAVAVKDEGVSVVATASGIDFVGAGVTATDGGSGVATVTIPGTAAPPGMGLAVTAVKTANYTAGVGELVPVDTTSGAVTVTLPSAPADKTTVAVKHVIQGGTNAVSIACGGADVFNKAGGATTATLALLAQAMLLQYKASTAIWYVVADDLPLGSLDLRYANLASPVFTGNPTGPTPAQGDNDTSLSTTAYVQTELGLMVPKSLVDAKGDLFVGTADNTVAKLTVGANGTVLTADSAQAGGVKWAAPDFSFYRALFPTAGRATTAAVSGTKYFCIPGTADTAAPTPVGAPGANLIMFLLTATDLAISGLTSKLRLVFTVTDTTAPAVTITGGLYPVAAGATMTLGTVVAGSTVAVASPAANAITSGNSGDFTLPSDGMYAVGYVVSGTPAGGFNMQAMVQVRNV